MIDPCCWDMVVAGGGVDARVGGFVLGVEGDVAAAGDGDG